MFVSLPSIPSVTKLTPFVTRILGHNPGPHTLQGTNSYVVGAPSLSRVLIDTTSKGIGLQSYLDHLKTELELCTTATPLSAILLTHWHPDHTEGVTAVLDLAHEIARRNTGIAEPIPVYKFPGGPDLKKLNFYQGDICDLEADQCIPVPLSDSNAVHIRVIPCPGHSVDHVCFVIERNGSPIWLFTGDTILGHGSTTVQDLPAYMNSLCVLRTLVESTKGQSEEPLLLLPSHGVESTDALGKIDEYIANRQSRINKAMEFLQSQPLDSWFNESDVMQFVYPEVPESLKLDAMINLRHSLFWIASRRGQNDQSLSLCAFASVGHTRREVTAECYSNMLASAERRILASQSQPIASDGHAILCAEWDWKRSST
ncbi:beta-lactamase-like protein 2 homolog [Clonorchis sinensis]|uniref:Beta-lactamase-like protein 2 homolog n=1 Tax=Clonorchis sinensis TaxID=79923 RepID=G7YKS6_CLOSI|nr:beta-lactamase-like protein 2 homolog [Clonorchis sinensis]